MDASILHYTQPTRITPMQYADEFDTQSCRVAGDYNEYSLYDVFNEGASISACHSVRKY